MVDIRLRVNPSILPRQIEMGTSETHLQWRYTDGDWVDLISFIDLLTAAGFVQSIVAGDGIDVDATDPTNPVVSVSP